jgi:uncharacterized protein YqeY
MKRPETARLSAIRLLLAAIKQREVDERIELSDAAVVAVIDKMLKQRRDSIAQYEAARHRSGDAERFEVDVLQDYMPQGLSPKRSRPPSLPRSPPGAAGRRTWAR